MERAAYRKELKNKRAIEIEKSKRKLALFLLLLVVIFVIIYASLNAQAENDSQNLNNNNDVNIEYIYTPNVGYITHQIIKGSTLWAIAIELSDELNLSIDATIDLIKDINNLTSDDVYEGQNIIVPYLIPQNMYI